MEALALGIKNYLPNLFTDIDSPVPSKWLLLAD